MNNPWKLSTFALITLFLTSIGSGSMVAMVAADPQPKMNEALEQLRSAARSLEAATADKGGHRAKAIELTRAAIGQVESGIKFDNRH